MPRQERRAAVTGDPASRNEPGLLDLRRRGFSLRIRAGERFELDAHMDVAPLRLLAIGGLVASILLSVPSIVRSARERSRPALGPGRTDV